MRTMIRVGAAALLLAAGLPLAADGHAQDGILVTAVDPDGPAAAAGIERGDLILGIDGQEVAAGSDLTEALRAAAEQEEITLTVKHGDDVRDRTVAIERVWGRPRLGLVLLGAGGRHGGFDRMGRNPEGWMFRFQGKMPEVPGAKVMEVAEDSPAAAAGLQPGDWITAVDGEALGEAKENLAEVIRGHQPGDSISVEYERDGEPMTATVNLGEHPETGGALLGVRYRTIPMFNAEDMPEMRRLFNWFRGRFDRSGDREGGDRDRGERLHRDRAMPETNDSL